MNNLLLMMGGSGTRFGADRPKQYVLVNGRPCFSYIVELIDQLECVDRVVIVSHKDWIEYVQEWCKVYLKNRKYEIVAGGANRSESVKNGLNCLKKWSDEKDVVLIHDATHPYVDQEGVKKVIEAVEQYGGATLGNRSYDTVYRITEDGFIEKVEPRELIYAGASPEAFRFGDIYRIYMESSDEELATMTSAGAIALAHGIPMKVVETTELNLKITYERDMKLFKKQLSYKEDAKD